MKPAFPILLLILSGCADGASAAEEGVVAAFERFQDALFAKDVPVIRAQLTRESREVASRLPLNRLAGKERLRILSVRRVGMERWITVEDPNRRGLHAVFVVVPEDGRFVVDLLATAAHEASWTETETAPVFEPRPLGPEEAERARAMGFVPAR
ncbi:MAG: hypothetical protein Fur0037_16290 [Planctomycetota bacterium]